MSQHTAVATTPGTRTALLAVAAAAAAAAVLNLVVLAIGGAAGAGLVAGGNPVGPVPVVAATLVTFAAGALVLRLLVRSRPAAVRTLAWLGLAVGVVTIVAPLTMASDGATGLTLAVMHVVCGIAWFLALTRARTRVG